MDLRCDNKLHGVLDTDEELLEVRCTSRWCGKRNGIVVLHRFNVHTGELVETLRFKDPTLTGLGKETEKHG